MARREMSEGRKTQVVLLDDRRLEILIQPKLYAGELLDLVSSHFQLKEKEYFGLSFRDETGHYHWLQLDRRVLEHDFPKKTGPLVLYFAVRFFIESIAYLRDNATIELFYLQAKSAIYKGIIECDTDTCFDLASYVLQANHSDYTDDELARKALKKLQVLPTSALRDHPSISYCEDRVIERYRKLNGQGRGPAIVNYMAICESLPTYGIHYYEVKDKSGIPWWLGLSYKGISLYDYTDKKTPRRVFAWKQLENLYFRDRKFSIEVHDPKRIVHTLSSFNLYEDAIQEPLDQFDELSDAISDPTTQVSVSRRTLGPSSVNVHAWFASTSQLTKCIWSMAVSQHQFYLDRKQSKVSLPQIRSMSEIAADLCRSTSSLHSSSTSENLSRSNSCHSLSAASIYKTELTLEDIENARAAQRDMYTALKNRKEVLERLLQEKTDELKELCLREAEIIGYLPKETPLVPGEPIPKVKRRMGTSYNLSSDIINKDKTTEAEEMLAKLELDFDLQSKITEAALKLAKDITVAKSVRKKRKQAYNRSSQKLKDLEKKLNDFRKHAGRPLKPANSVENLSEDSREFLDDEPEYISPVNSPPTQQREIRIHPRYPAYQPPVTRATDQGQVKIITSPKVEVVEFERPDSPSNKRASTPSSQGSGSVPGSHQRSGSPASPQKHAQGMSRGSTPSPGPQRHYLSGHQGQHGYTPNSIYSTGYRSKMYPTFTTRSHSTSASSSQSEYDNINGAGPPPYIPRGYGTRVDDLSHNLYNVNIHRTSRYDSSDELKPVDVDRESYDSYDSEYEPKHTKHGSLEGAYRKRNRSHEHVHDQLRFNSLERQLSHDMDLAELTPSKFGSKRESHSDAKDSPFTYIEMPTNYQGSVHPPSEPYRNYNQQYSDHSSTREYGISSTGERSQNVPFIDSSQSSLSSGASSTQYYSEEGPMPRAPYEHGSVFKRNESAPAHMEHMQPHPHSQHTSPSYVVPTPPNMTVTKYQNFVEVSKPFLTEDVYKYSEKRRRQLKASAELDSSIGSGSQTPEQLSPNPNQLTSPFPQSPDQGPPSSSSSSQGARPNSPGLYEKPASPYLPSKSSQFHPPRAYPPPYSVHSNIAQVQYQHYQHPAYQSGRRTSHDQPSNHNTPKTPHRSFNDSRAADMSFGNLDTGESLASAFSTEMLAWYEDQDNPPPEGEYPGPHGDPSYHHQGDASPYHEHSHPHPPQHKRPSKSSTLV